MKDYMKIYEQWLADPYFDEDTKNELRAIADDENEIKERFYMDLEFGTAGLRGIIGAGINRMNIYTVRRATQGLANYIKKQGGEEKGVAIAFDSRRMSPEFAMEAAMTLAANGIKAYKFESLRPTPELSFAVRELGCIAGINITASHNPPEYNGYKVYWEDGAQFTPPHDKGVLEEVLAIEDLSTVKTTSEEEALRSGKFQVIGKEIDDKYIENVKAQVVNQDAIDRMQKDITIIYTPLHGTGNIPARRVMKELGFENVYVVPEQELPDGNFPTVSYPNPEAEEAFALGLKLAKEKNADLVLATDPDADRLGVYVKDAKTGEYHPLTGNMSGSLLCDYVLGQKQAKGQIPADGQVIKSIVTTNLVNAVAEHYGCELVEVLTGFKYIGQQILKEEQTGKGTYMFGMEESYGCLIGTYARDKDAISATAALCEAAAYYKEKGMTLWDAMVAMYEKYGYYKDTVKSIGLKGIEGLAKIQEIMENFRQEPPKTLGDYTVTAARDYKAGTIMDMASGAVRPTGLPSANVLYYEMNDGAWLCVRPSGTEPKIKFYYGVKGTSMEDADARSEKMGAELTELVNKML
ncbi:phospho-sugar mutase [Lachnospiraceae bacterium BX10]|uniref:Phosphoglucomutase n=2 Tax=Lachnospiraceae TaxID=186803 RepID=A0ABR7NQA1_9FIRM|nr:MULTISPECIES: phospho-sugar mutase [Lachnospiraceae]MBC8598294.1 phospho-sugar mutase [Enterocloster hominis]MCU6799089.1 phospho-sugar mutase [Alitiscatomonas aceti]